MFAVQTLRPYAIAAALICATISSQAQEPHAPAPPTPADPPPAVAPAAPAPPAENSRTEEPAVEAKTEGYSLEIKSAAATAKPFDAIVLTVDLSIITDESIRMTLQSPHTLYKFKVEHALIGAVPLTQYGKQRDQAPKPPTPFAFTLKRGTSLTHAFTINRLVDMSLPGIYKITAETTVPRQKDTKQKVTIKSNTVEIKVENESAAELLKIPD